MSFKRCNDVWGGRVALQQTLFSGVSYNSGKIDQSKGFHYSSDLNFFGSKPKLRNGAIKSDAMGSTYSVDGLFHFSLWSSPMQGSIQNGVLSLAFVSDVIQGQTQYSTWGDVYDRYSWQQMDGRTWLEILEGE